jgi:branched-chain amino acid transport system substrate-binding protein
VAGFKSVYGNDYGRLVAAVSYEVADATVESQILNLKSEGVEVLMLAATPKFAAQAIRRTAEVGWKPMQIINLVSSSISATLKPAGLDNATGGITSAFYKDPGDNRWAEDEGVRKYRAFAEKYLPGADLYDINYITGFNQGGILENLLKQAGADLSRTNILTQMLGFKNVSLPMILPGITINTSPKRHAAFTQLQLQRWTGTNWELFGNVVSAESD